MPTIEILRILLYFMIYSFFGWILESILKSIIEKKFVNSGFLHGPYCPIYAFGAFIMIFCLSGLKNHYILLFAASFIVLTIWEYIVGWYLEKIFHTKYWDYSENRCNFKGRVCLLNSFYWGILGVIFIMIVHPFIEGLIKDLSQELLIYLNILLYIALITDAIASIIKIKSIEKRLEKIKQINETIKEKVEQLKQLKASKKLKELVHKKDGQQENLEDSIKAIIEDLRLQQNKLKLGMYKQFNRLRKAFPTMKSEAMSHFLSQKIDLKQLKEKIKKKSKEIRK